LFDQEQVAVNFGACGKRASGLLATIGATFGGYVRPVSRIAGETTAVQLAGMVMNHLQFGLVRTSMGEPILVFNDFTRHLAWRMADFCRHRRHRRSVAALARHHEVPE